MLSQSTQYIPAGCVWLRQEETELTVNTWYRKDLQNWKQFALPGEVVLSDCSNPGQYLDPDVQRVLLGASILHPYARLFNAHWIKLLFSINPEGAGHGILRVYLLPDDVQRSAVDRSNSGLRKARQAILNSLDYSQDSWDGRSMLARTNHPRRLNSDDLDSVDDVSLLQVFNLIPSPDPKPDTVLEPHAQDAMNDLLNNKTSGLLSVLFPYQRRSAALMLQREAQPGTYLDPRLMQVQDQQGSVWYLDSVLGTILKEPRHYDGISGGILAEDMGLGKTIICLALILATKDLPALSPELYGPGEVPIRSSTASLADMAASCANRNSVPWKPYFDFQKTELGNEYSQCIKALQRNRGYYLLPAPEPRRGGRRPSYFFAVPKKIFLSSGSVIVVPTNLVTQWQQEIHKHTKGLAVLTLTKNDDIPPLEALLDYDVILFSQSRFEKIFKQCPGVEESPLSYIHFKRCIVDEGHKLGNSKIGNKSTLLTTLDALHFSARWIVTGTPSHGLFGVDSRTMTDAFAKDQEDSLTRTKKEKRLEASSIDMEKKDLERIGSITALYLKARPWANTAGEAGDTLADWSVYLMLPKHNAKSRGRWDCLKLTLNSLIIRHRFSEIGDLLPPVKEKIVILDGSYQDRLSLNLFSMMIIFNSVQSQRTDMDYFFHAKQRRSLLEIVTNLKQASFFGGSFFKSEDIAKAVQTAEQFLQEGQVNITPEDKALLDRAIVFGHVAMGNRLRVSSNQFHDIPVSLEDFPGSASQSWSLDGQAGNRISTSATMLLALQKIVAKSLDDTGRLNSLLNGGLIQEGASEKENILAAQAADKATAPKDKGSQTLAGNTKLGDDSPHKARSHGINDMRAKSAITSSTSLGPLGLAKITSTASSKLSYLLDCITRYQHEEKIIIFYENENTAWYLASMLDVLQIQHLIYAKSLKAERKTQYVNTFHNNTSFRVLLMDISQAAFGLDMREASRIYFISPVLNPQVEAQAIGRVRRISQQKPVTVEILVLRHSIEEVILERRKHMTQAEHRQTKSILDVRPVYDWIKNASIIPLAVPNDEMQSQMTPLEKPLFIFGGAFGRELDPDEGIMMDNPPGVNQPQGAKTNYSKRSHDEMGHGGEYQSPEHNGEASASEPTARPARRVRFTPDLDG